MEENILKILKKKAIGYTITESVKEYVIDEQGSKRPVKYKTTKKYYPPDMQALKVYIEMTDNDKYSSLSIEELKIEKKRLLNELFSMEGGKNEITKTNAKE